MSDNEEITSALHASISAAFMEHGKHAAKLGLVANWVLVSETIDEEGGLWLNMNHSEHVTKWATIGLLLAASDNYREQLRVIEAES